MHLREKKSQRIIETQETLSAQFFNVKRKVYIATAVIYCYRCDI